MAAFSPGRLLVALIAAMAVILMAPGLGLSPTAVHADVGSISVSSSSGVDNDVIAVTVMAQDDDGTLVISAGSANEVFSSVTCSPNPCGANLTVNGNSVSILTGGLDGDLVLESLTVSLSLTINCDNNVGENIIVSATQDGDTNTRSITCGDPNNHDTDITIYKQANSSSGSFPFGFSVSNGTCVVYKNGNVVASGASGSFSLADNQHVSIDCTANAVITITEDVDSTLVDVTGCSNESGVSEGSRSVRINMAQADGSVSCTFVNSKVNLPATLSVVASNLQPTCGTTSTLTAYVVNGDGSPNNGTVVTFSATPGNLSSSTATTVSGAASVVYTAPSNFNGTANVTVTAGAAVVTGQLRITCPTTVVTAPPPPVVQPPLPPAPPVQPQVVAPVAPPRAGEGGFVEATHGGFSWALFAGIILAASVSMGVCFVAQREKA